MDAVSGERFLCWPSFSVFRSEENTGEKEDKTRREIPRWTNVQQKEE